MKSRNPSLHVAPHAADTAQGIHGSYCETEARDRGRYGGDRTETPQQLGAYSVWLIVKRAEKELTLNNLINERNGMNKKNTEDATIITDELRRQILAVRDTGRTNMFDVRAVQRIAHELDLFELVVFLEDRRNWSIYSGFILHGKTK